MSDYYSEKKETMPRSVYNQTLWLIRGYAERMDEANDIIEAQGAPDGMPRGSGISDPTAIKAERVSQLLEQNRAVDRALARVPEYYRTNVWTNIVTKRAMRSLPGYNNASPGTWKRWRRVFIYAVAEEAGLWEE